MIGGFMAVGTPNRAIAALVERGVRGLTIIANDTARPGVCERALDPPHLWACNFPHPPGRP
ncbi:CoA-transferase [Methylobacterium sp. CB376]|uniref:CoA-transferase n=1 Tax=Methylobacterium sp. CB376 TaxID=3138063 RepID=UPI0006825FCD|nr:MULTISPECIES: CoA-transferase [Methylobacterium]WFT79033.1 CoA-transferase [Methylobacterium nodulans]